ncbi:hypothetical protein BHE74_00008722 [Ensete ventricosum]|nr:hypothetical protein BHE74_00008722 [Ensete ventricosum]
MRTTPRPVSYKPPTPSCPSLPKKLTREELRDRSAKGLCWHCDESWSRDHRCKKGCLLLIEPLEDMEEELQEHEEEVAVEEKQPVNMTMRALAGYVIDRRILKCDRRCPRVKLLLQDQEITTDFSLLPLDDYEFEIPPLILNSNCYSVGATSCRAVPARGCSPAARLQGQRPPVPARKGQLSATRPQGQRPPVASPQRGGACRLHRCNGDGGAEKEEDDLGHSI